MDIFINVVILSSIGFGILYSFYRLYTTANRVLLCAVNAIGAVFIGPAAFMATAMGAVHGTTLLSNIILGLCALGIPLAIICIIMSVYYERKNQSDKSIQVLRVPIVYAAVWFVSFIVLTSTGGI